MKSLARRSVAACRSSVAALAFLLWAAAGPAPAEQTLSFVGAGTTRRVIPDAHTYTGHIGHLPSIVERAPDVGGINALKPQPDFVASLGDNVAGGPDHKVLDDAAAYQACVSRLRAPHYYVIGNHECIPVEIYNLLTWEQLLGAWNMKSRWYSFDVKGVHVCVLDGWVSLGSARFAADFRRQQEWFEQDLRSTDRKTIVFIHDAIGFQQQDCKYWVDTNNRKFWPPGNFFEKTIEANASAKPSGGRAASKILGVFEGHKHASLVKKQNGVAYHSMGASFMRGGQFAQVFIDAGTGDWFVLGHPEKTEQSPEFDIQQTYGDRRVMERFGKTAAPGIPAVVP